MPEPSPRPRELVVTVVVRSAREAAAGTAGRRGEGDADAAHRVAVLILDRRLQRRLENRADQRALRRPRRGRDARGGASVLLKLKVAPVDTSATVAVTV